MIISTDAEKLHEKIEESFMIEITLSKLEQRGNFLNLMKNIYKKLPANVMLNGKKLKAFQDQEQGKYIPSHHCFSTSY